MTAWHVAERMVNWIYCTYIGSVILCTDSRGVKIFLAKINGARTARHVPGKKSKLDKLNKFWEWDNTYCHKRI